MGKRTTIFLPLRCFDVLKVILLVRINAKSSSSSQKKVWDWKEGGGLVVVGGGGEEGRKE